MQVLCKKTMTSSDVRCSVCGQGFVVYWERQSRDEQNLSRREVMQALAEHHNANDGAAAHPEAGFNVPDWNGLPKFSAAALLGGAPAWAI